MRAVFKVDCLTGAKALAYRKLAGGFKRAIMLDGRIVSIHQAPQQARIAQHWARQIVEADKGWPRLVPAMHYADGTLAARVWFFKTPAGHTYVAAGHQSLSYDTAVANVAIEVPPGIGINTDSIPVLRMTSQVAAVTSYETIEKLAKVAELFISLPVNPATAELLRSEMRDVLTAALRGHVED